MKKVIFMIIPVLICGVMFFASCNKDGISDSAMNIYAFGQSTTKNATNDESETGNQGLWCTGNDIKWYNATTGELKLKNLPKVPYWTLFKLTVFLDDVELFSLATVNPYSSQSLCFPCIDWKQGEREYIGCKCGDKRDHTFGAICESIHKEEIGRYYISKGYPKWDPKDRGPETSHWDWESIDAVREENWKVIELGWNIFIQQLKKEGKYRK